jgi:hypothetical protein
METLHNINNNNIHILDSHGGKYCGIFAQSKNFGARETAIAR